ncbi:hypothetical protein GCM10010411_13510 [Actinomadura fulvescens]|uniref:Mutator family transposase n=1 Tax=Actinomadura fulvescens TaxID=46160 RepID=A0ABN3PEN3_9ACTN
MERPAEQLGVTRLSKSQASALARELHEMVADSRNRPLDAWPCTLMCVDALTQKVREGGRIVNVHTLIATGVNADGHREILGVDVVPPRTVRAGRRSCAHWSPAACPECGW